MTDTKPRKQRRPHPYSPGVACDKVIELRASRDQRLKEALSEHDRQRAEIATQFDAREKERETEIRNKVPEDQRDRFDQMVVTLTPKAAE